MDLGLKDKVALVTGGGDGIGRITVLTFASEGAHVIVNDIVASKADKVANEAKALGVRAMPLVVDVSNTDQVNEAFKKAHAEFSRVDILVNVAFASDRVPFSRSTRADWEKPINVCLYGTLNCSRAVIESMITRRYGKIVSILSDAGRVGEPWLPVYGAAKAGILAFSKGLAKEVGRYNINVNCVSPGATNSPRRLQNLEAQLAACKTEEEKTRFKERQEKTLKLYPIGRVGEPEDVANMIVYLSSDLAKHITGQAVSVNGGYTMV